jgi:hypothetical protein
MPNSLAAAPGTVHGNLSRPISNPTKLSVSAEATPSKAREASSDFEAGNLISFDETSQILKDPWNVPSQRIVKGVKHGNSTVSQASSVNGPNNPQQKPAWSVKKDLFPATNTPVSLSASSAMPPRFKQSSNAVKVLPPVQNEVQQTRQDGPKPLVLSPFDPDNPTFRANTFFDPDILPLGKYKCPHTGCG